MVQIFILILLIYLLKYNMFPKNITDYKKCCNKYGCHDSKCHLIREIFATPFLIIGLYSDSEKNYYVYSKLNKITNVDEIFIIKNNDIEKISQNTPNIHYYSPDLVKYLNYKYYDHNATYERYKAFIENNMKINLDQIHNIFKLNVQVDKTIFVGKDEKNNFYEIIEIPIVPRKNIYIYYILLDKYYLYEIKPYDYKRFEVDDEISIFNKSIKLIKEINI